MIRMLWDKLQALFGSSTSSSLQQQADDAGSVRRRSRQAEEQEQELDTTTQDDDEHYHHYFDQFLNYVMEAPAPKAGAAITTMIPLCCQLENWDCGIACILMVMRWLRSEEGGHPRPMTTDEVKQRSAFLESIGSQSIWTADLIVLLEELSTYKYHQQSSSSSPSTMSSMRYLFCSKTLTVDQHHSYLDYYRAAFVDDSARVSNKFQQLKANGAPMCKIDNLSIHRVVELIQRPNCVAIALVDNSILCCCPPMVETTRSDRKQSLSYTGHYILLCGVSDNADHIRQATSYVGRDETIELSSCLVALNPGKTAVMYITLEYFEQAWRATGTDEDIIFVAKISKQGR